MGKVSTGILIIIPKKRSIQRSLLSIQKLSMDENHQDRVMKDGDFWLSVKKQTRGKRCRSSTLKLELAQRSKRGGKRDNNKLRKSVERDEVRR